MIIFPAIDLAKGRCVRLLQGRREDETVYAADPVAMARRWETEGAEWLHLVDLDAAFDGRSENMKAVEQIVSSVHIPVQLGGGIRSLEKIELLLSLGVSRVILGTTAIENPLLIQQAIEKFGGGAIVIGIDAKKGRVALRGWTRESEISPLDLGRKMKETGAGTFVYTDIGRDGMLTGPNIPALKDFSEAVCGGVIASGGIGSLEDIRNVSKMSSVGVVGIVTGKALYEKKFTLKEAIHMAQGK